jgi:arsenite/tail-anchored protein-transporting ATPase
VAKHHAHRYAVIPLLREEPIGIAHLMELSGHIVQTAREPL